MSLEYNLCPKSFVYVPTVQFMSLEYSLYPWSTDESLEYSVSP